MKHINYLFVLLIISACNGNDRSDTRASEKEYAEYSGKTVESITTDAKQAKIRFTDGSVLYFYSRRSSKHSTYLTSFKTREKTAIYIYPEINKKEGK